MRADYHLHTSHSADSKSSMRSMIEQGIRLGLKTMCFTEHMDYDTPKEMGDFTLDTPSYYEEYRALSGEYKEQIEVLFGVELGLQPHLAELHRQYIQEWPFDFVIGSCHLAEGCDPYYPRFFKEHGEEEGYHLYFEGIMKNLKAFSEFDTFGHLDYVVRYGPNQNREYSYAKYQDILEPVLELLVEKGIALEVNSGGLKYGLGEPNPCIDVLKAYKKMGGERITIGSDAHEPCYIAYEFEKIRKILLECGFTSYTEFRSRESASVEL